MNLKIIASKMLNLEQQAMIKKISTSYVSEKEIKHFIFYEIIHSRKVSILKSLVASICDTNIKDMSFLRKANAQLVKYRSGSTKPVEITAKLRNLVTTAIFLSKYYDILGQDDYLDFFSKIKQGIKESGLHDNDKDHFIDILRVYVIDNTPAVNTYYKNESATAI